VNQQVAEAFKKLYFGKRTGVLNCEAASARRAVYFSSGFVVSAQSSLTEDRLGEVMMRHGRITRQQFDDASHFIKSGWRLGEILTELNVIAEEEIQAFVRLQLLDIACTQLISPPKRLAFSPLTSVDSFLEAPLSVADILMEAVRRTPEIDDVLRSLKQDSRRIGFPKDPLKRFQDVNLKPEEAFVLSRVDGTQTPSDIFSVSPLSEEMTARTLAGLLHAELIVPEGEQAVEGGASAAEPEKAPPPTGSSEPEVDRDREVAEIELLFQEYQFKNHWEVLGVERGAPREEIEQAFLRGARRFHPDRFRRNTDPEFQEKLSYLFRRVNEARDVLTSEARSGYEELAEKESMYEESRRRSFPSSESPRSRPAADAASAKALFQRAQHAYRQGDFWSAIQLCQQSVDLAPERAEVYHLLGLSLSKNPKWRQDAEKYLRIATNLDPWKGEYFVSLGKLYQDVGLHLRAQKTFEKAKTVDPAIDVPDV
jgi:curved DNA-binding protein CbpA